MKAIDGGEEMRRGAGWESYRIRLDAARVPVSSRPRGNVDPTIARRHEEEQLEQRIEEEAGEVKKRKCTPIEYLLLFARCQE